MVWYASRLQLLGLLEADIDLLGTNNDSRFSTGRFSTGTPTVRASFESFLDRSKQDESNKTHMRDYHIYQIAGHKSLWSHQHPFLYTDISTGFQKKKENTRIGSSSTHQTMPWAIVTSPTSHNNDFQSTRNISSTSTAKVARNLPIHLWCPFLASLKATLAVLMKVIELNSTAKFTPCFSTYATVAAMLAPQSGPDAAALYYRATKYQQASPISS
jgi:hypothetical protein